VGYASSRDILCSGARRSWFSTPAFCASEDLLYFGTTLEREVSAEEAETVAGRTASLTQLLAELDIIPGVSGPRKRSRSS